MVNKVFCTQIGRNMEIYVDDMLINSREAANHEANIKESFENLRRYNLRLNPDKCVLGVTSMKFLGYMISQRGIDSNPDKIVVVRAMQSPQTQKDVQSLTGRITTLTRLISRAGDRSLPFFKAIKKGRGFEWTPECEAAGVLCQPSNERGREQLSLDGEAPLCLDCGHLEAKAFYEAHLVEVVMDQPLRQILENPSWSRWIVKWVIELNEFDPRYKLQRRRAEIDLPGRNGLLWSLEGQKIEYALRFACTAMINKAEYEALANELALANALGVEHIHVRTDSQLLVGHLKGDFKIDEAKERRVGYLRRVCGLTRLFLSCHMEHVRRERNQEAKMLSQLATTEYGLMQGSTPVERVAEEAFWIKKVMNNVPEGEKTVCRPWYQDILEFLSSLVLREDYPMATTIQR
ncbi:hypothetical protein LIER_18502 [Lithospermum erythrorhizon]|uniref:Reverse transcriptase domain-containing protein n=1 Tax=Lithospermum erythrorhizon TaxID=34254 RepID=A0AAV3QF75_LITER